MEEEIFISGVEEGLNLSKRVSRDRATSAPNPNPSFSVSTEGKSVFLPTAPMVYAVISDPAIVENPDVPSYQPHVYGRCDPPALIPLHMGRVDVRIDCHVDTAVVSFSGRWRLHCVMRSRSCDCRLVVPMGEQGSILGVEVDVARRSYSTRVVQREEEGHKHNKTEDGGFLKPHLFFITIPQVEGGCEISIKVSWTQKLLYKDGQFAISMPFNFPEYVNPFAKIFPKQQKIQLNVNSGIGKEIVIQRTSHALKEESRHVGTLSLLYEADVEHWSTNDFHFSYSVYSSDLFGGVLLQSPSMQDYDQRQMFYLYLFPGNNQSRKVFRKEVVFLVDISGSMRGKPLENVKNAISTAILELTPLDYFDIIAFNEEMYLFSSSLEPASEDMIENATQWINKIFVAKGGTNLMQPLNEAMKLLSRTRDSLPHIFLITDGSVDDERDICSAMRTHVMNRGSMSPHISSFGIGTYCNHYFLQMLALIGKGHYEASYDPDTTEVRMRRWFRKALSPILANITVDVFDHLNEFEVYPSHIPDLSVGGPLLISGRFKGKFPDSVKVKGCLADMSDMVVDLKVKTAKDISLEKVCAKQQIDLLTAQSWFSGSKQLEDKVMRLSIQTGFTSEYTSMALLEDEEEKQDVVKQSLKQNKKKQDRCRDIRVYGLTLGFGNVIATAENLPAGFGEPKPPEAFGIALNKAVGCCSRLCDCCCCMCFIKTCSKLSDQCVIVMTQLCAALSCLGCFECCSLCCGGD